MKRLVVAIVVGGVVDVVATNLATIPFLVVAFMSLSHVASGPPSAASIAATLQNDPVLHTGALVAGALCAVLGGFAAAWLARRDEVVSGALSSWLGIGLEILTLVTHPHLSQNPLWLAVLIMPLGPLLGALGGFVVLAIRQRGRAKRA